MGIFTLALLCYYKRLRSRRYITSSCLPDPKESAWSILWKNGDDLSFISLTGFDRQSFIELHDYIFENYNFNSTGRKSKLDTHAKLGLLLHFLNSTMKLKTLCQIFGVSQSTVSRELSKMSRLTLDRLYQHPKAKIVWPNQKSKAEFAEMIRSRQPEIENAFGFLDGLALSVECSSEEQNPYYNGWYSDTSVNNILVFSPFGKVMYAAVNYYGSWHDAHVSSDLLRNYLNDDGYSLIADSAFPAKGEFKGRILKPIKKLSRDPLVADSQRIRSSAIVSLRQAVEWGMRTLQATFSRLKLRLSSDKDKRHDIIMLTLLLHNFRTHNMGINQIRTVFSPNYEAHLRDESYDRIARYYNINEE